MTVMVQPVVEGGSPVLKVIRRSDGKELLRYKAANRGFVGYALLGGGKYLVANEMDRPSPAVLESGRLKNRMLFWKLDQPEKPLWETELDSEYTRTLTRIATRSYRMLPDGKHFREFSSTPEATSAYTYELESGKLVKSQKLNELVGQDPRFFAEPTIWWRAPTAN